MARKTNIGGQAVIEGVMMRGPKKTSVAVRKPDGTIDVKVEDSISLTKKNKFFSLPIVRGAVSLVDSLMVGVKTLTYSASFFEEDVEKTKFDKYIEEKLGDKAEGFYTGISLFFSFAIAMLLFFVLPTTTANIMKKATENSIIINLAEGALRLLIFLIYIYLISKMEDIQRVFEYHGAEHKSIFCYEAGLELTPENARNFKRLHPRCGTNFMLIVMIISILVFSFFGWPNIVERIISRIVLLPLIAGISYEFIKWLGRSESVLAKKLSYPGLMLQNLTTREPDDSQLEVAIAALKAVIDREEDDNW